MSISLCGTGKPDREFLPELFEGTLIKRYKRFLADVRLNSGETVTAHCANTGSMLECSEPGKKVWLSYHVNPKRKYNYSWEVINMGPSLVGISTNLPNKLVKVSIEAGLVDEFSGYDCVRPEIKTNKDTRLDFKLSGPGRRECYIEVKNCTLVKGGEAFFPDAVTKRGLKHLQELQKLASEGNRAVMFYLIQRSDAKSFQPADHIDPDYGQALRKAVKYGVELVVYDVTISLNENYIKLRDKIPYFL